MNFVGVDLAWSQRGRGRTGVCAAAQGRVVASALVRTDDEIVAWLRPWLDSDVLIGVDAPVIVENEKGQRPCEQSISSAFGRYHAGCHSSNQQRFSEGTRALRLAELLKLEVDPRFDPDAPVRRLIEVYPHPAMVTLFGLPLTLKYKAKRGRSAALRRSEFGALISHLESLKSADPPLDVRTHVRWNELKATALTEASNAALDRVEDELDAYVCAYVALYHWSHGPPRSRVIGDLETGYIVVPMAGAASGSPLHEAAGRLTTSPA